MKKMMESCGWRVLAFILCCALGLLTVGCVFGFAYVTYEPGMGRNDARDFLHSELCRSYAMDQAWSVISPAVDMASQHY